MAVKRRFYQNPEIVLITMVILALLLTVMFGLAARRSGRAVPTDQNYIEKRTELVAK